MAPKVQIFPVGRKGTERVYSAIIRWDGGQVLGLTATVSEPLYRRLASSVGMLEQYLRQNVRAPALSDLAGGQCLACDVPGRVFQRLTEAWAAHGDSVGAVRQVPDWAEIRWRFDDFEGIEARLLPDAMAHWHATRDAAGAIARRGGRRPAVVRPGTADLLHRYALASGYL